jgi:hypothetical protein
MPIRLVLGVLDGRVTDLLHEERWLSHAFGGRRCLIGTAGVPSKSELFPRVAARLSRWKGSLCLALVLAGSPGVWLAGPIC